MIYTINIHFGEIMTTTYELKIYGRVQHVGFRDRIEDIGKMIFGLLDNNTRILTKMDEKLDLHTEILENHTRILTKMDEKLDILNENQLRIIETLDKINNTLDKIEKKL